MDSYNWFLFSTINEHWAWQQVFTPQECQSIIDTGLNLPIEPATVINSKTISSIRKTNISWIPASENNKWIFEKCTQQILTANQNYFNFELHQIESLQFTAYDELDHFYGKHVDQLYQPPGNPRKLSFSIQLSEPSTYEGGELLLYYGSKPAVVKKEIGVGSFFPSYMLHEVTPITKGKRYSLVGWVNGPKFR